jgi:hypothetical protein
MPNSNIPTNDLRAILMRALGAAGQPVTKAEGFSSAQKYRFTAGPNVGKTVRFRTNRGYAVMSLADDVGDTAPISALESVDFCAFACVNPERQIECYLVPSARIVPDMKESNRGTTERHLQRGEPNTNKVRVLHLSERSGVEYGFARKYAEFRLPSPPTETVAGPVDRPQGPSRGSSVIERAQHMIADEFGVPVHAVRISIDLVGGPRPIGGDFLGQL